MSIASKKPAATRDRGLTQSLSHLVGDSRPCILFASLALQPGVTIKRGRSEFLIFTLGRTTHSLPPLHPLHPPIQSVAHRHGPLSDSPIHIDLLNHILHSVPNGLRVQFSRDQDYDCVKIASPGPVSDVRRQKWLPPANCQVPLKRRRPPTCLPWLYL